MCRYPPYPQASAAVVQERMGKLTAAMAGEDLPGVLRA